MTSLTLEKLEQLAPVMGQPHIRVGNIRKTFSGNAAVDDVSLELGKGEFVTLLGASGCGKTTLLRIIAGFVSADRGEIFCGDANITRQPPARRGMGFVFQSYALFPTKTVAQNIGFSNMIRSMPRARLQARVSELAAMVELEHLLDRYPHELSGGQQQRVALARALASEPEVLLLDEPMSALDARIRSKLRADLRALVDRLGITTLFVTHDQEEAFALSDRIAVMSQGRIEQVGTPSEIYHRPATRFVAEFVGVSNLVTGRATQHGLDVEGAIWPALLPDDVRTGEDVTLLYRPEHLAIQSPDPKSVGIPGRIEMATFSGASVRLQVVAETGQNLIVDVPSVSHAGYRKGQSVRVVANLARAWALPDGSK